MPLPHRDEVKKHYAVGAVMRSVTPAPEPVATDPTISSDPNAALEFLGRFADGSAVGQNAESSEASVASSSHGKSSSALPPAVPWALPSGPMPWHAPRGQQPQRGGTTVRSGGSFLDALAAQQLLPQLPQARHKPGGQMPSQEQARACFFQRVPLSFPC